MKRTSILITLSLFIILALSGCGEGDLGTAVTAENMPTPESEIAKIEANEHMPQHAKDAAIGAIKARAEASRVQAEAAKAAKKP